MNAQNSTRPQRYRRQLFTVHQLEQSAPSWASRLQPLYNDWKSLKLSDAEAASIYLLIGLETRLPGRWLGGKSPTRLSAFSNGPRLSDWIALSPVLARHFREDTTIAEVIHGFSLKGVRLVARETLLHWLQGEWPLVLTEQIPSPVKLLEEQIWGRRMVTAAFKKEELSLYLHDDRDALSFLLHDLGHAEQFYRNDLNRCGQIASYRLLHEAHLAGLLFAPRAYSNKWEDQLDYLIADLNTHPLHFWSVFWASARENFGPEKNHNFELWRKDLFLLWNLPQRIQSIMERPSRNVSAINSEILLQYLFQRGSEKLN